MSLLARVSVLLSERGIAYAVIGAAALAVHGVSRATADLDLLALDPLCLDPSLWRTLREEGVAVDLRHGDADDPLAGVARLVHEGAVLDLILGRSAWQRSVLERAQPRRIGEVEVPVATASDLVLLKLYAGGPQDGWDIHQLLDAEPTLAGVVEPLVAELPRESVAFWQRIRRERAAQ